MMTENEIQILADASRMADIACQRLVGGVYDTDQEHMDWIKHSTQQLNQQSSTA
jgi:hypothetical protein